VRKQTRLLVVVGCHGDDTKNILPCPFRMSERTEGAGCAEDYRCTAVFSKNKLGRVTKEYAVIDGYVEYPSEMRKPGDFPRFCPLSKNERGYKPHGKAGQ
jgi:hypothetical protein